MNPIKCGKCENYTYPGACHVCGAEVVPPEMNRPDYSMPRKTDGIVLAILAIIIFIGFVVAPVVSP